MGRGVFAGEVAGLPEVLAGFPLMALGGAVLPLDGLTDVDAEVPVVATAGPPIGGGVALHVMAVEALGAVPADPVGSVSAGVPADAVVASGLVELSP